MRKIQTVTGEINSDQLGKTLIHEHVFCALPGFNIDSRILYDDDDVVEKCVSMLKAVRKVGFQTIVDATPSNWYRRPELLRKISELSEVHIVVSTGMYTERMGIPFHLKLCTVDELTEIFVREIENGIDQTGVKAGIMKCATSQQTVSKTERKFLEAAVQVQKVTGVGIITHTEIDAGGTEQAEVFAETGGDLSRIVVGHCDNSNSVEYHESVLRTGVNLGFDRIGHFLITPDEDRIQCASALLKKGYAKQLLFSQDAVGLGLGKFFSTPENDRWEKYGFCYLIEEFIPQLIEKGISFDEPLMDQLFVKNPRRVLSGDE